MFSSNPSSINVPPPYLFDPEKNGFSFTHNEQNSNPFVFNDYLLNSHKSFTVPPPSPPPEVTAITQDLIFQHQQLHEDYDDLLEAVVYPTKKKTVTSKKDGHTKIFTAQGPRDRRVRLSIDIARKFFELQNLLGFDKASETLDWLFTKSKVAIRELVEETKHSSSSTFSAENCESAFLESINGGSDELQTKKSAFKFLDGKKKKVGQKNKSGSHVDLAREQIRAEARARARERTKEKLRIKKLQNELPKFPDEYSCNHAVSSLNLKLQSRFWGQIESESDYN